jgi:hypothetical protein
MAGPLGAGRITIDLIDAALTTREGQCVVHQVDFVSLRVNGVPAFTNSRRGTWELDRDAGAILVPGGGPQLQIYTQEFDDSATIRQFAGNPPGSLSVAGVLRLDLSSSEGTRREIFLDFESAPDVEVTQAGGMTRVLAAAALAELEGDVEEGRRWREMLWGQIAPRVALLGDLSGRVTGLGVAMKDRTLWGFAGGLAELAWLRGDQPRDSDWRTEEGLAVHSRSEHVWELDHGPGNTGALPRAGVAPEGFSEAAVFRAFRSAQGQAWLETRFLRARRRENHLELFPEVDEHSFGSPLVLRDGAAGVVTGYSKALPWSAIAAEAADPAAR